LGDRSFTLPLPGDFNVANAAIVLAYLLTAGVELDKACDVLQLVTAPPGRMQRVGGVDVPIYVDYAHTPNALESALRALRPHCRGELYCVFGCGGDRDAGKRPMMAKLAERYADKIVISSDNPRSENPRQIIREIAHGLRHPDDAIVIEDRAAAIAWAITRASADDIVLIAGKGHEDYQEIRGERKAFSDYAQALAAAKSRDGVA
jgi:UDP-N-acetylmuramoyl-L-alanyl-D-glutamate--2,6-diaminopimelate ligase